MKPRVRGTIVGLGATLGLLVAIAALLSGLAWYAGDGPLAPARGEFGPIALGLSLGAFLAGGFAMGWASSTPRMFDVVSVALGVLVVTALAYSAFSWAGGGAFMGGMWLAYDSGQLAFTWQYGLFAAGAVALATAGAVLGSLMRVPTDTTFERVAVMLGWAGSMAGLTALALLSASDPAGQGWSIDPLMAALAAAAVLAALGIAFWRFLRGAPYLEDVSIDPARTRDRSAAGAGPRDKAV